MNLALLPRPAGTIPLPLALLFFGVALLALLLELLGDVLQAGFLLLLDLLPGKLGLPLFSLSIGLRALEGFALLLLAGLDLPGLLELRPEVGLACSGDLAVALGLGRL